MDCIHIALEPERDAHILFGCSKFFPNFRYCTRCGQHFEINKEDENDADSSNRNYFAIFSHNPFDPSAFEIRDLLRYDVPSLPNDHSLKCKFTIECLHHVRLSVKSSTLSHASSVTTFSLSLCHTDACTRIVTRACRGKCAFHRIDTALRRIVLFTRRVK